MRYLMLHNSRNREQLISDLIVEQIKKKDEDAFVYVSYWDEPNNNIVDIVQFMPDVIFTFPFTISDLIEEISLIKKICGCKVCTYTTEGYAACEDIRNRFMGFYDYPADLIDEYLFFGPKYERIFIEEQKRLGRLGEKSVSRAVGYPPYELNRVIGRYKNDCVERLKEISANYKKTVVVLSGFQGADHSYKQVKESNDAYNSRSKDTDIAIKEVMRRNQHRANYREIYYEMIKSAAQNNRDSLFIIKLHPIEIAEISKKTSQIYAELERYENIIVMRESVPVSQLFSFASCSIHYGSTASVESYIMNVPTIYIEGCIPEIFQSDYCVGINDAIKLINILKGDLAVNHKEERETFIYEYFSYMRDQLYNPSELIASELYDLGLREKYAYDEYVDYGYYRKLYKAYMLMAIKRYVLLRWGEAWKYLQMKRMIAQYAKKYW